jgi:hypothetical protein
MIPLWKGKNPIYFGVIRSNVKVTITINRILTTGSFPFHRVIMWPSLVKIQYTELKLSCGNDPVVKILFIVMVTLTFDLMTPKYIGFFPFHRGIMWPSLVKIQYTELKLSCRNDPVKQDRFRTITLVLYIGSWPSLATWFPCGRGRTLFMLGSLVSPGKSVQYFYLYILIEIVAY